MKSEISYLNNSITVIKENLKQFWLLSLLAFGGYFLSGSFPIMISANDLVYMSSFIESCLTNLNPVFVVIDLLLPVLAAILVLKYLNFTGSVIAVHAFPLSRNQLFVANYISGLILITVPALLNEIIMQLLARPVYPYRMYIDYTLGQSSLPDTANIFTHKAVFMWFIQTFVILLFVYSISYLAGMLSGNIIMHFCMCGGLLFFVPALLVSVRAYAMMFLYGFTEVGTFNTIFSISSPFIALWRFRSVFSFALYIGYVFTAIIVSIIAWQLYKHRKLELTGDSLLHKFSVIMVNYILTFLGMTLMAFYFETVLAPKEEYAAICFIGGAVIGGLIAFILSRMIALKALNIFNKEFALNLGIFTLVAAIFISSFFFDTTGYESRVPKPSSVKAVVCNTFETFQTSERYSNYRFNNTANPTDNMDLSESKFVLASPEVLESIYKFHKTIVDNINTSNAKPHECCYSYTLDYKLKNDILGLQREYYLPYSQVLTNKGLKEIYESEEFKNHYALKNLKADKILSIYIDPVTCNNFSEGRIGVNISDEREKEEFIAALDKDFKARTLEEEMSPKLDFAKMSLILVDPDDYKDTKSVSMEISILHSDTSAIKWLEDHNYKQAVEVNTNNISKMVVRCLKNGEYIYDSSDKNNNENSKESKSRNVSLQMDITDPQRFKDIISTCQKGVTSYSNYYEIDVTCKGTLGEDHNITVFFQHDNAPKYIKDYFEENM